MTDKVRVRFAPSPTGEPHVGNIRTAIFDWLLARHTGGEFIIRVEDTDQNRKREGAIEAMLDSLRWLGIDWDEGPDIGGSYGPYYQSQRLHLYHDTVQQLIESNAAYRCYCTSERLEEVRKKQASLKQDTRYDRRCRYLTDAERREFEESGYTYVVRFAMPLDGATTLNDLVRDEVTFENRLIDDFVILKTDGFPTYHLAHIVDDHFMEISHVLRSEEWLPSSPRHLQIYKALGWEPPQFAHLPLILAPDRAKLSKRHGATSVLEFRDMGYVPDAMVNFLTLLGWSLDDKTEILSREELVKYFSIARVAKAGALFDAEKLNWMNGYYIRQMSDDVLAGCLLEYWRRFPPPEIPALPSKDELVRMVPLVRERLKTLADAAPLLPFFFKDEIEFESEELIQKGMDAESTLSGLRHALDALSNLEQFDGGTIEHTLREQAKELNVKPGQHFGALRVATTGLRVSPPLFQTMEVLGKERTIAFIRKAIERLEPSTVYQK